MTCLPGVAPAKVVRIQAVKRLLAGRAGVVLSGLESWSFTGATLLEVFAPQKDDGLAGCLGAGTAAAVAKPESPLDWSAVTPLLVLAGSCLATGDLRPPTFTGSASPALSSASETHFVPSTMLPAGLPAHQNHIHSHIHIQAMSLNP